MSPTIAATAPVLDVISERWSPRAFDTDHALETEELQSLMEAARWAPSASNTQPWRFIVARRGTESFAKIVSSLAQGNRAWAPAASALIVNLAETQDLDGNTRPWAEYDLGQAVAYLTLQAHSSGLFVHQMGGFSRDAVRSAFGVEERLLPVSVTAIGRQGDPDQLPEELQVREGAGRTRYTLEDLVVVDE